MKAEKSDYYACSNKGYVKVQNVDVIDQNISNQIPVSSKCNEILPYKLHKIQIKEPLIQQKKSMNIDLKEINNLIQKRQIDNNFSFSLDLIQGSNQMMQKDEVVSIHLNSKANSHRVKHFSDQTSLTKSFITNVKKSKDQMKRSLNSLQDSAYTQAINKGNNDKFEKIYAEMMKERTHRKKLEQKYEILLNLVETQKHVKTSQSDIQDDKISQKMKRQIYKVQKKHKNSECYIKQNAQSQQSSCDQAPLHRKTTKTQRLNPRLIEFQSQPTETQHPQLSQLIENFNQMKEKIQIMDENIQFLERKIQAQDRKFQKEMLERDLRERERQIQRMERENFKLQQVNDVLMVSQLKDRKGEVSNTQESKFIQRNSVAINFFIALVFLLLILSIKDKIC